MEFGGGGSHQEMPSVGIYGYYFWNITLALAAHVANQELLQNLFIYLE